MGRDVPYFITLEEAIEITFNRKIKTYAEIINIEDAYTRILSRPLSAMADDPPFDNSSMDGFATSYSEPSHLLQT